MIKVSGLPTQITKSDLEDLFAPYGKIQITQNSIIIQIKEDESIAFVELDNKDNEEKAILSLNNKRWRGFILHVNAFRGSGDLLGQVGDLSGQQGGHGGNH